MGYSAIGFYITCSSPLVSALLYIYAPRLVMPRGIHAYGLLYLKVNTAIHTLVIALQLCGLILYLLGYKSQQLRLPVLLDPVLCSIPLILWGLLITWFSIGFYYQVLIPWSMEPGVRELMIWDHLEHATWALKGVLWVSAGLVFVVTSCIRKDVHTQV